MVLEAVMLFALAGGLFLVMKVLAKENKLDKSEDEAPKPGEISQQ